MKSKDAGKMYLKYGPVYFTNDEVENVRDATMLSVDKIFETSPRDAALIFNCRHLIMCLHGMKLSAQANEASLHHFSSGFEISGYEEWFYTYVDNANISKSTKEQLLDARIKY